MELKFSHKACELLQREIRASKCTYKFIAEKASLNKATVSNIAAGTTRFPRFETVVVLLKFFGYQVRVEKVEKGKKTPEYYYEQLKRIPSSAATSNTRN